MRIGTLIFAALLAAYLVFAVWDSWQVYLGEKSPDWMLLTGGFAGLVGLRHAFDGVDYRNSLVDDLSARGILLGTDAQVASLRRDLTRLARRRALMGAAITAPAQAAIVILGAAVSDYGDPIHMSAWQWRQAVATASVQNWLLVAVGLGAGVFIGFFLGGYGAYGSFVPRAEANGCTFRPAYRDDAAKNALGMLHPYYWRRASLSVLPTAWILAWLVLTAFQPFRDDYGHWRLSLALLLLVALYFSFVGLFVLRRGVERLLNRAQSRAEEADNPLIAGVRRAFGPPPAVIAIATAGALVACGAAALLSANPESTPSRAAALY